jgi:hypothetical protein
LFQQFITKKATRVLDAHHKWYEAGESQMKKYLALVGLTGLAVSTIAISLSGKPQPRAAAADAKNSQAVVVELFTSEGCSSCPPADALLMRLRATQPVQGANIIAWEEHVDYWNHDGWNDPFSSSDWTMRQQDYVARFKEKEPYTPQMVVDGQTQVLGSAEPQAQQAILQAAAQPKTEVTVAQDGAGNGGQQYQYKVHVGKLAGDTDRDTAEVWLAVTESGLGSSVGAGENAGKTLRHAPVLRSLHKIGVASSKGDTAYEGAAKVKVNRDWKHENLQVAVFVQEKKSMKILGAASTTVAN